MNSLSGMDVMIWLRGWWGLFWPLMLGGSLMMLLFVAPGLGVGLVSAKRRLAEGWKDEIPAMFWKVFSLGLVGVNLGLVFCVNSILESSSHDLNSHSNLYYRMWKEGLRGYDQAVALGGLFHDQEYRASLKGISRERFERIFPSTFYEIKHPQPWIKPGQTACIPSYSRSLEENVGGAGWVVIFEGNRLVRFDYSKG